MRCFRKACAIAAVAAVYAIVAPAYALVTTYHGGGYASHSGHYSVGYGSHVHHYVGSAGPHVITFDPQAYQATNPYQPGEPAAAPMMAAPRSRTIDVSCLVSRPVSNSHDDFAGYRLFDACDGSWAH